MWAAPFCHERKKYVTLLTKTMHFASIYIIDMRFRRIFLQISAANSKIHTTAFLPLREMQEFTAKGRETNEL